jgi:hypothetical protein
MIIFSALDKAILQTIIYFDLFNFPVTAREVYYNLIGVQSVSFTKVQNALKELSKNKLSEKEGFYFLPGRDEIIAKRKEHYLIAEKKFELALKNAKRLRRLPFVKAIFLANTLSYSNAKDSSDIDLVIITKKERIWTARFFCAGLMKLLKQRPTQTDKKNKICLSFYLTEDNLNLEPYAYKNDIHFAFWAKQFFPLYDPEKLYHKFQQENQWASKLIPNYLKYKPNDRRVLTSPSIIQKLIPACCPRSMERLLKKFQLKIMPIHLQNLAIKDNSDVIISDTILKFHDQDKRQHYNELWQAKCKQLIPNFDLSLLYKIASKLIAR